MSEQDLTYTNWHQPESSVLLEMLPLLNDVLEQGHRYEVSIRGEGGSGAPESAVLHLEWIGVGGEGVPRR